MGDKQAHVDLTQEIRATLSSRLTAANLNSPKKEGTGFSLTRLAAKGNSSKGPPPPSFVLSELLAYFLMIIRDEGI